MIKNCKLYCHTSHDNYQKGKFMEEFKKMLFETIKHFNQNTDEKIDWTVVWEDEEKFETVIDALDALIDGVALLPDIEDMKRIHLLGRLALMRSHLSHCYGNEQQIAHFLKHGEKFESLMRDVINCSGWLSMAQQRFDEYVEFEETVTEDTHLTQKQLDHFRPILMALALMSIITIEDEEYVQEEGEDDEEDEFDEDEE